MTSSGIAHVHDPDAFEERRLTARAVADIQDVLASVAERAGELLPGESVDEIADSWPQHLEAFSQLVEGLMPSEPANYTRLKTAYETRDQLIRAGNPPATVADFIDLDSIGLTGAVGHAKRSTLGRLRDRFKRFFKSLPFKHWMRIRAIGALADYLEFASAFVQSIPFAKEIKEKVVECIDLFHSLAEIRRKRKE